MNNDKCLKNLVSYILIKRLRTVLVNYKNTFTIHDSDAKDFAHLHKLRSLLFSMDNIAPPREGVLTNTRFGSRQATPRWC